jgi:hypothetical protein
VLEQQPALVENAQVRLRVRAEGSQQGQQGRRGRRAPAERGAPAAKVPLKRKRWRALRSIC